MSVHFTHTAINPVKVNNVTAVDQILRQSDSYFPLTVVPEGNDGAGTLVTFANEFADETLWPSARSALHEEPGDKEFTDLLLELVPYLASPLTVQVAAFDSAGNFDAAKEWIVQPGATEVEIKEIVSLPEE
jgi:hypothetical protein